MIECPVCTTKNGDLSVVCTSCGGYLQTRVQTLDLFQTLWQLIESPGKAFKRIILSEQKNYIHFLASVGGIGFIFTWLWRTHGGLFFENLMWLILLGILAGPVAGIAILYIGSAVSSVSSRTTGIRRRFRDVKSVFGYSLVPLVFATVFLMPLKLGLYGLYFFTGNPSPMVLNPAPYMVLLALDGLAVLWSVVLLAIGTHVLTSTRWRTSFILSVVTFAVIGSLFVPVPW